MLENETPNRSTPPVDTPCRPLELERQRRKDSDHALQDSMSKIETRIGKLETTSKLILGCVGAMVLAASLEYAGVIGKGVKHSIWSHAVLDGVRVAITKQVSP